MESREAGRLRPSGLGVDCSLTITLLATDGRGPAAPALLIDKKPRYLQQRGNKEGIQTPELNRSATKEHMRSEGHRSSLLPKAAPPASAPCSRRPAGAAGRREAVRNVTDGRQLPPAQACARAEPRDAALWGSQAPHSDSRAPGSFTAAWLLFNPVVQALRGGLPGMGVYKDSGCPPGSVLQSLLPSLDCCLLNWILTHCFQILSPLFPLF